MKFALCLIKNADGLVIAHNRIAYNDLAEVEENGFTADRWGFTTEEAANQAGNLLVGTDGNIELTQDDVLRQEADSPSESIPGQLHSDQSHL